MDTIKHNGNQHTGYHLLWSLIMYNRRKEPKSTSHLGPSVNG